MDASFEFNPWINPGDWNTSSRLEDQAEVDERKSAFDEVFGTEGETSSPVQDFGMEKVAKAEISLLQGEQRSKICAAFKKAFDSRVQPESEFRRFCASVLPVLRFDPNPDQLYKLRQIFDLYQTLAPSGLLAILDNPEKFHDYFKRRLYGAWVDDKYAFNLLIVMIQTFISGSIYTNKIADEVDKLKSAFDEVFGAAKEAKGETSSPGKFDAAIKEAFDYRIQSESEFRQFYASVRPVLRFDPNPDQLDKLCRIFDQYRTYAPSGFRAILEHPEKFHDYIKRELFKPWVLTEEYDFNFVMVMMHRFINGSIYTNKIAGSRLDAGALMTSAGVHSFPMEQYSFDVVEKVSDHCLNNGTHDPLSQNPGNGAELLVWLKENFARDLATRDPTLFKILLGSDVFLSTGMISKYTPGSLLVEILQLLAIGSATVGVVATATGLYLIFRQRRSLPFGFEREVLIEILEDVGIIATVFAFVGGMSLLLPNNLSRFVVVAVLCAVLFLIIFFIKLRPEGEAETESVGSPGPTDLASNPSAVAIELLDLSESV